MSSSSTPLTRHFLVSETYKGSVRDIADGRATIFCSRHGGPRISPQGLGCGASFIDDKWQVESNFGDGHRTALIPFANSPAVSRKKPLLIFTSRKMGDCSSSSWDKSPAAKHAGRNEGYRTHTVDMISRCKSADASPSEVEVDTRNISARAQRALTPCAASVPTTEAHKPTHGTDEEQVTVLLPYEAYMRGEGTDLPTDYYASDERLSYNNGKPHGAIDVYVAPHNYQYGFNLFAQAPPERSFGSTRTAEVKPSRFTHVYSIQVPCPESLLEGFVTADGRGIGCGECQYHEVKGILTLKGDEAEKAAELDREFTAVDGDSTNSPPDALKATVGSLGKWYTQKVTFEDANNTVRVPGRYYDQPMAKFVVPDGDSTSAMPFDWDTHEVYDSDDKFYFSSPEDGSTNDCIISRLRTFRNQKALDVGKVGPMTGTRYERRQDEREGLWLEVKATTYVRLQEPKEGAYSSQCSALPGYQGLRPTDTETNKDVVGDFPVRSLIHDPSVRYLEFAERVAATGPNAKGKQTEVASMSTTAQDMHYYQDPDDPAGVFTVKMFVPQSEEEQAQLRAEIAEANADIGSRPSTAALPGLKDAKSTDTVPEAPPGYAIGKSAGGKGSAFLSVLSSGRHAASGQGSEAADDTASVRSSSSRRKRFFGGRFCSGKPQ